MTDNRVFFFLLLLFSGCLTDNEKFFLEQKITGENVITENNIRSFEHEGYSFISKEDVSGFLYGFKSLNL